jgi:DNA-binding NarL/FixJ family response regulator
MKKIVLIDDHEIFREGIKLFLAQQSDLEVCGEASNLAAAIQLIEKSKPDLALLDISLGDESGIDLLKHFTRHKTETRILVLSMHDDPTYLKRCLELNAKGFVLKSEGGKELLSALEHVMAGEVYISSSLSRQLARAYAQSYNQENQPYKVTSREVEIIRLISKGHTSHQIADILHISYRTVESHRSNLFKKLKVNNSIELLNKAQQLAILDV